MKSNEELQRDVQEALKYERMLHPAEIGVIAHNGVITLTGTVESYPKKRAAEKAAEKVRGVKAVVEKIEVVPKGHFAQTDEEIAHALLHAFKWTWNLPDDKIITKVENGWVWLMGTLEWAYQREMAAKVAGEVPGVKGITNAILLKSEIRDKQARENIEAALKRNWAVDVTNVQVKVEHNKVTLSGTVDSLYERSQSARIAWNTPGITDVDNRLVVEFADDVY